MTKSLKRLRRASNKRVKSYKRHVGGRGNENTPKKDNTLEKDKATVNTQLLNLLQFDPNGKQQEYEKRIHESMAILMNYSLNTVYVVLSEMIEKGRITNREAKQIWSIFTNYLSNSNIFQRFK